MASDTDRKTNLHGARAGDDDDDVTKAVRKPDILENEVNWSSWAEAFKAYINLANMSDRAKVKVLLTYLSPKILRNKVGTELNEAKQNNLELAMTRLGKLIAPPKYRIASRLRLNKMEQGDNTLPEFIDALRRTARDCECSDDEVSSITINHAISFYSRVERPYYSL